MARNIDRLFEMESFRAWLLRAGQTHAQPFSFILSRDGQGLPEKIIPEGTSDVEHRALEMLSTPFQLRAAIILSADLQVGDGRIAEKLLEPYDEEFLAMCWAGLCAIEELLEGDLDQVMYFHGSYISDHLRYLATGTEQSDARPNPFEINQLVVRLLSDSNRLMSIPSISREVNMGSNYLTHLLIGAFESTLAIDRVLSEDTQNREALSQVLVGGDIAALLEGMTTDVHLLLADHRKRTLTLGVVSALDYAYDNFPDISFESWARSLFEGECVALHEVEEVSAGVKELGITHSKPQALAQVESSQALVGFLRRRFGMLYKLAVCLMQQFDAVRRYELAHFHELKHWAPCARISLTMDGIKLLPLVAAIQEGFESEELHFGKPLVDPLEPGQHEKDTPKRMLKPVPGTDHQSRKVILSVLFEEASLDSWWPTCYSLRSRRDMMQKVKQLGEREQAFLDEADFYDYIKSMGYADASIQRQDYIGHVGLKKAIEVHSLLHLDWWGLATGRAVLLDRPQVYERAGGFSWRENLR